MKILARSIGRRKEAVAQVQLVRGTGQFTINKKSAEIYLQNNTFSLLKINSPFEALSSNLSTQTLQKNSETPTEQDLQTSVIKKKEFSDEFLNPANFLNQLDIFVKVKGGGLIGQAEAIKLALARALCKIEHSHSSMTTVQDTVIQETSQYNSGLHDIILNVESPEVSKVDTGITNLNKKEIRKILKLKGYLTQDARVKERRKYGLKKARKAPQYSKR
jgi:small subunit ribosomal protein S9